MRSKDIVLIGAASMVASLAPLVRAEQGKDILTREKPMPPPIIPKEDFNNYTIGTRKKPRRDKQRLKGLRP